MCEQIAKSMGNWDSIDQNVWRMQPCEEHSGGGASLCGEEGSPFASSYKHGRDLKYKNFPKSPPIIHDQCDNSILVIVAQMVTSNKQTTNSHKSVPSPPLAWGWALYPQAAGGAPLSIHKQLYVGERLVPLRLYFWTFQYKKTNYFRSHWFECCFVFQIANHFGPSIKHLSKGGYQIIKMEI